jgi:hypothetical protein
MNELVSYFPVSLVDEMGVSCPLIFIDGSTSAVMNKSDAFSHSSG